MASKRSAGTAGTEKAKRKRSSLTLEVKLDILKRKEQGEGTSAISRNLGLAQSTVWTVLKNREAIKKAGENATHLQSKLLTKHREPIMDKMERLLKIWIDNQNHKYICLSLNLVCQKALSIIERLKVEMGVEDFEFKASKGWFDKFRRRSALHNIKVTGESAGADKETAGKFKPELEKCIEENGYSKKLYWKRMTSKTYIDKEEKSAKGFKVSKDRLTLLLGGNAEGLDKTLQEAEKEGDEEEEPVCGLDIKTLRECLGSIKKALETLKEHDTNPARSSKVAHDVEKSVKIYQEIYDEKRRNARQPSISSFFKPVRSADPVTADPSTSVANGSAAGPSFICSFFKPVKHANPATAGPSTSASDSADDEVFEGFQPPASPSSSSAHSVEDE